MSKVKGAYIDCQWCHGAGCLQCEIEREKDAKRYQDQLENPQPIFTANLNDPQDVDLLRQFLGKAAIDRAFSPAGQGTLEIERNAAIASLIQALRKRQNESQPEEPHDR